MEFGKNNTPFSEAEFSDRLAKTKARMSEAKLDTLIVSDPSNMNYLTGYDGWSFYVHQAVVVALELEQPLWIGRLQDANGAKLTTILSHENIYGYSDDHVQSTVKHPMQFVAAVLRERGLAMGAIGVEADNYYFSGKALDVLRAELSGARIEDAGVLVNWVRAVKSEREIELMREAARITERVMQAAVDAMGAGVPQCEVAAVIQATQARGTEAYGGDYPAIVPLMPIGRRHVVPAPHLAGRAVRERHRHLHRDRRRAPPLPRADDAHRLSRHAAGADGRRGEDRGGGDRERPSRSRSPARTARDVHARVEPHDRAPRPLQGIALRLSDRRLLPAGLGRAHLFAALHRRDGA